MKKFIFFGMLFFISLLVVGVAQAMCSESNCACTGTTAKTCASFQIHTETNDEDCSYYSEECNNLAPINCVTHMTGGYANCARGCTGNIAPVSVFVTKDSCANAGYVWNGYCGDNVCQASNNEDIRSCFKDCFNNGWSTDDDGWSLSGDYLSVSGSDKTIYSDSFDLKADKEYVLHADVSVDACDITISLDDSCIDPSTWKQTDCDLSTDTSLIFDIPLSTNYYFTKSSSQYAVNGVYFKDVRLKIVSSYCNSGSALIANISLKENAPNIVYDSEKMPSSMYSSGCCPKDHCWDGNVCVNSANWMENPATPAKWNSLFDASWKDDHVLSSKIPESIGYRCMILDSSKGAEWIRSEIKYDWNYQTSGYCLRDSDCFVGLDRDILDEDYGSSKGCAKSGMLVSDKFEPNKGNNYCLNGNWTTKSYVMASALQNFSEGKPYSLYCDTNTSLMYNFIGDASSRNIVSACVIQINKSNNNIQTITAINAISSNDLVSDIKNSYESATGKTLTGKTLSSGSNTNTAGLLYSGDNFKLYKDSTYDYVIISDQNIVAISPTVWDVIKGLFLKKGSDRLSSNAINYDRIYLRYNGTAIVISGIEDAKYSEEYNKIVHALYISYNGTTQATNKIDEKAINKTITESKKNISMNINTSKQEIILVTKESSGLWQYFTNILR